MNTESQICTRFIVIDDDPINNIICSKYIQLLYPEASVETFTDPGKGLEFIRLKYSAGDTNESILFLDINMPILSGWDVLERFAVFSETIKSQFKIYMLSSSVAAEDRERAGSNALVSGFMEKPLSLSQLKEVCF